jgi:hypothetical protein
VNVFMPCPVWIKEYGQSIRGIPDTACQDWTEILEVMKAAARRGSA